MILRTNNREWGFYGVTKMDYESETVTDNKWDEAFIALQQRTYLTDEDIRKFLDSKDGRYLADACLNEEVEEVIKEGLLKGWLRLPLLKHENTLQEELNKLYKKRNKLQDKLSYVQNEINNLLTYYSVQACLGEVKE